MTVVKNFVRQVAIVAIAATISLIAVAQEKGDWAVGGELLFFTSDEPGGVNTIFIGIGANIQYNVTNPIRLEGSFKYVLPREIIAIDGYHVDRTSWWKTDLDVHYLFRANNKVTTYPLAGFSILGQKHTFDNIDPLAQLGRGPDHTYTLNRMGLNLGGGIDFKLSERMNLKADLKYGIYGGGDIKRDGTVTNNVNVGKFGGFFFSTGVVFKLNQSNGRQSSTITVTRNIPDFPVAEQPVVKKSKPPRTKELSKSQGRFINFVDVNFGWTWDKEPNFSSDEGFKNGHEISSWGRLNLNYKLLWNLNPDRTTGIKLNPAIKFSYSTEISIAASLGLNIYTNSERWIFGAGVYPLTLSYHEYSVYTLNRLIPQWEPDEFLSYEYLEFTSSRGELYGVFRLSNHFGIKFGLDYVLPWQKFKWHQYHEYDPMGNPIINDYDFRNTRFTALGGILINW